ncbi:hypothetical protein B0F90DRAFT_1806929 [Multifurca ochricompacta]|uniref:Ribosomal protein/NADH dehydrogenase domain-containing protein n=1 Tax=Multifurca ochricompacta TaxID=376703 RepID=A0AAD4MC48_9AGAM|nr:hypothetical protein B0F90DRAFT_1806929 [Multifurca ochricompacta]
MPKPLPGPSRLSQILKNLNRAPRPTLVGVRGITLTLARRNDHFGARYFLKDDLPRIRYANPKLDIQVNKFSKTKEETWQPELLLEFSDGRKQCLNIHNKWSSRIFQELMDVAGGNSWTRWKTERREAGLPAVDGPPEKHATGAAAVLP